MKVAEDERGGSTEGVNLSGDPKGLGTAIGYLTQKAAWNLAFQTFTNGYFNKLSKEKWRWDFFLKYCLFN